MNAIVNGLVSVIILALVISHLFTLLEPYAPWLVLGLVAFVIGGAVYRRARQF